MPHGALPNDVVMELAEAALRIKEFQTAFAEAATNHGARSEP